MYGFRARGGGGGGAQISEGKKQHDRYLTTNKAPQMVWGYLHVVLKK